MQFDWYQCSVPATISHCMHTMKEHLGGEFGSIDGIARYPKGMEHLTTGIRVYHGGSQPLPHVIASSRSAVECADFVRKAYPLHRVSRLDAAQDYSEPKAFDRLCSIIDPICRDKNVECMFQGDIHPEQTSGRSMYFGAANSDVRLLVYEKGLEQIGKGKKHVDPDWVRMELRVRFRKGMKDTASTLSPEALYGRSRWSVEVSEKALGVLPEYIPDPSLRQSDTMKALDHMFKQYSRTLRKATAEIGEEEMLVRFRNAIG